MKTKLTLIVISLFIFHCGQLENNREQNKFRIISLSPHITEIIYALNTDSNLVAVTDFCKYPPEAKQKEKIGGLLNPNIEKIISLRPTHIFGVPAHAKLNRELDKFGIQIMMTPNETISDLQKCIKLISDTLEIQNAGNQLIDLIKDSLQSVKFKYSNKKLINGMLIIGREKGSINNITVAGANTFIDELWNLAGGKNSFFDLGVKYSTVNLEEIIKRNPDVIIEFDLFSPEELKRINIGKEWGVLKDVNAVKNKNYFVICGNYSLIPGPRMVKIAGQFSKIINMLSH